jgi:uncharacterized protein (TIGR02145 family)
MKKSFILLFSLFAGASIIAQDYYIIDFAGEGATPQTVFVENLTQGTSLEMSGSDILHLNIVSTDISEDISAGEKIAIYPNPLESHASLKFYNGKSGFVRISKYSICGKQLFDYENYLEFGFHTYNFSGVLEGSYLLTIQTPTDIFSETFISVNKQNTILEFNYDGLIHNLERNEDKDIHLQTGSSYNKNNKSYEEMNFAPGDILKIPGSADTYINSIIVDSPNGDKTYTFEFAAWFECGEIYIDSRDSRAYQTIQFGSQCWMAENLAYLPHITDEAVWGSDTESQYSVHSYVPGSGNETIAGAKATDEYITYGALYNWPAIMDGAVGSNANPGYIKGICPAGWHIPGDAEWQVLEIHLGMTQSDAGSTGWRGINQGSKLAGNTELWNDGPLRSNVEFGTSGFNGLPAGFRGSCGAFYSLNSGGGWWTAAEVSELNSWLRYLDMYNTGISRNERLKQAAYPVRCVRN